MKIIPNQSVSVKLILILFFMIAIKIDSTAQKSKSSDYPRIEFYSEIDKGDPNSGNNKWTDPSGKTVYGGKREYRPYITRKTYLINKKQETQLLEMPLLWLPYFGEQKENITLGQYFKAVTNSNRNELYSMLPKNLNQFYSKKKNDENYQFYSTLLGYEKSYPQSFTVVWLDENTWFVNDIYYSITGDLTKLMQNAKEDIVAEGQFVDFLRLSPIFQYKLTEGFPDLNTHALNNPIPLNKVVLGIALSPGMPNTKSYDVQIAGDGYIMNQGFKSKQKIDPNVLTYILLKAQKLSLTNNNLAPKPHVHDGQTFTISVWKDGVLYKIESPDLSSESSPLTIFVKMVNEKLKIK
jgi:hypothetical protein